MPTHFRTFVRRFFVAYLSLVIGLSPVVPTLAQAQQQAAPTTEQQLPELGSAQTQQAQATSQANELPVAQPFAGTNPDLAPGALQPRSQGFQEALAQGVGRVSSAASEITEGWFAKHHITAALGLSVDRDGFNGGSLDVLIPFNRSAKDLVFVQGGMRRASTYTEDARNTMNLGVGYRRDTGAWLLGTNAFYDHDVTGGHHRLGLGLEAWTDFLKISGNSYLPLSSWKTSPDRTGFVERPASGWDLRGEGFLPMYPQLGAKLMFEQYYGDQVSLFTAGTRQHDPSALTVGAIYNPVPLIAVGVEHRTGQSGMDDTTANLTLNYRIGEPLARQLSSANLAASRLVANTRYDLVARNNEIVLDNREVPVPLRLPTVLSGAEGETLQFSVVGANRFSGFQWMGDAAEFAHPLTPDGRGAVTLPLFNSGGNNTYSLQAVGISQHGGHHQSNLMTLTVSVGNLRLEASPTSIVANGVTTTTLSARFKENVGAGVPVQWSTDAGDLASETSFTDEDSVAHVELTSATQAGTANLTAVSRGSTATGQVTFTAGFPGSFSTVAVDAAPTSIIADGISATTVSATVRDDFGNLVNAGVPVTWQTDVGTLVAGSTQTNSDGVATVKLTSATLAGQATVKATAGPVKDTTTVTFFAGPPAATAGGLTLTASATSIPVDGSSSILTALVKDAHGNTVGAGVEVIWEAGLGILSTTSSLTDASGTATTVLRSGQVAGESLVQAKAGAAEERATVTFTPGNPGAGTTGLSMQVSQTEIVADGISTSTLTAMVRDSNGNRVDAGVAVNWTSNLGNLDAASSTTDADGVATMTLRSATSAGTATLEASATNARDTASVTFKPGAPNELSLVASPAQLTADGQSSTTLRATLKDTNGNPVGAGVPVSWSTNGGTLVEGRVSNTDANGVATVRLTAPTEVGSATVEALSGAAQNSTTVTFVSGIPGNGGMQLSVTPAGTGDRATLNATVKDAFGNLVAAGVVVNWTTSAGQLSGPSSTTDSAGVATIELSSTQVGDVATVTATAGVATASATVEFDSGVPAIGSNGLSLAFTRDAGSNTANFTATLRDSYGNTVPEGVVVNWTATTGTLAGGVSSTNANGEASMNLAGTVNTASYVEATSVGASNGLTVTFQPGEPALGSFGIGLVATPASIVADGTSTSVVRATLRDSRGNAVDAGTRVDWTTIGGRLDHAVTFTDSNGVTEVQLTSSTSAGTAKVSGSSGDASNTVDVTMMAGAPAPGGLTVTASPATLPADGSSRTTLSAVVQDAAGNRVGADVSVTWSTSAGVLAWGNTVTDSNGVARVQLTSGTQVVTANINVVAGAANTTASVAFTAPAAATMTVVPSAPSITADGRTTSTLTATVRDALGRLVVAGTRVDWVTSIGTLVGNSSVTDANGQATMQLTSGTVAGTASVRATAGTVISNANVLFVAAAPASVVVTSSANNLIANGVTTATLTAEVRDAQGNLVSGATVTWATTAGVLATGTSVTGTNGSATRVITSPSSAGTGVITARAGNATTGPSNAYVMTFVGGAPASITGFATTATSIVADNTSTAILTAVVRDAQGNPVGAGVDVNWTTSAGNLHAARSQTNSSGQVMMVLTSNLQIGTVNLTVAAATNTQANARLDVTFIGAAINSITMSVNDNWIHAVPRPIAAVVVRDIHGRPAANRTVTWDGNGGIAFSSATSITDAAGIASVTLTGSYILNTQLSLIARSEGVASNRMTIYNTVFRP